MFGTAEDPGLIPKSLHRIFRNVGQNIDNKVLFKPVGLENFIPTNDGDLNMEIAARNYIFKDEKVRVFFGRNDLMLLDIFSIEFVYRILFNNKIIWKIFLLKVK
jgi:hypothetical protein